MGQSSPKEFEALKHIFSEEAMPSGAERGLFSVLNTQVGMETFVKTFGRKLLFLETTVDNVPAFRVTSSMSEDGYFIHNEEPVLWHDNPSGKNTPCITMVLAEHTGEAILEVYEQEVAKALIG